MLPPTFIGHSGLTIASLLPSHQSSNDTLYTPLYYVQSQMMYLLTYRLSTQHLYMCTYFPYMTCTDTKGSQA